MWDVAFQILAVSIVRWNYHGPVIHEIQGRWIPLNVLILYSELKHLNNPLRHLDQWNLHVSTEMQQLLQFYRRLRVPEERDLLLRAQRMPTTVSVNSNSNASNTLCTFLADSDPHKPTILSQHCTNGISKVFWTTCTVGSRPHRTDPISSSARRK